MNNDEQLLQLANDEQIVKHRFKEDVKNWSQQRLQDAPFVITKQSLE